jgi:putative DNA primase/helicase
MRVCNRSSFSLSESFYVDVMPMLVVSSPEKRCGKTILLGLLSKLVSKPLPASNMLSAAMYRVIEQLRPTLLIDEVDTWLKENEESRGVINSGHTKELAFVLRCDSDSGEVQRFSTWSPKVLAGIGKLADTLVDRSISIHLERRRPTEPIAKLRDAMPGQFERLRSQLVRWANDHGDWIAEARPAIPDSLDDRQGDNWFPLFAIADELGGKWPDQARQAALVLSDSDEAETTATILLAKIRTCFDEWKEKEFLRTAVLLEYLNEDQSLPWADWAGGKGLTEKKLGVMLKAFGVKSDRHR